MSPVNEEFGIDVSCRAEGDHADVPSIITSPENRGLNYRLIWAKGEFLRFDCVAT
jgi:hypothetical protein